MMRRSTRIAKKRKAAEEPTPSCSKVAGINEEPPSPSMSAENERIIACRGRMRETREKLEQDAEYDPLFVLPELVIENLIKFIKDPRDKFSLSRASISSDRELHKSKQKWLFFEIFKIPTLWDYLSNTDVLNIRRVCKDWRFSFQDFIDNRNFILADYTSPSYRSLLSPASAGYKRRLWLEHETHFSLQPQITSFTGDAALESLVQLAEDEDFQGNPILTRGLSLLPVVNGRVNTVLDRFGKGVQFVHCSYHSSRTPADMTERTRRTLEKMPHLHSLIWNYESNRSNLDSGSSTPSPSLPPLPSLKRLSVSAIANRDKKTRMKLLYQPFACYFDQLVSFEEGHQGPASGFLTWYDPLVHSGFPNLNHLRVSVGNETALFKLWRMKCPLRELGIESELDGSTSLTAYFTVAESFTGTLQALKIKRHFLCGGPVERMDSCGLGLPKREKVHLPHLKILALGIKDCGYGLMDPLLKLTQPPQYLELIVKKCKKRTSDIPTRQHKMENKEARAGAGEVLKIHEHLLTDMYKSNVWTLWKGLEELRVWRPDFLTINERLRGMEDPDIKYTRTGYNDFTNEHQTCSLVGRKKLRLK